MSQDLLFNKVDIFSIIQNHTSTVNKRIESIPANTILNASEHDLTQSLIEDFRLNVPVIEESEIYIAHSVETPVDVRHDGSVASFGTEQEFAEKTSFLGTLGGHFEEFVDEPILTPDVTPAQPPHLALPNYVHRLIALSRSSRSLEFAEPLLGLHWPFDRAMVLLDDVVQILDGGGTGCAASLPSSCLRWPSRKSAPGPC